MTTAPLIGGIFPHVPEKDYRAITAMNQTTLKRGAQSPAHMLHAIEHPEAFEETEALRFGRLFHLALLEPDRVEAEVTTACPINRTTGEPYGFGTKAWAAAEAEAGLILCKPEWTQRIDAMVAKVRSHKAAKALLSKGGETEVVCIWDDPVTGVQCKTRIDYWSRGICLLDVKTTEDASPAEFENAVSRYGYDIQAAFLRDGWFVNTGEDNPFGILAVEKEPPFGVAVYELTPGAVARGRWKYRRALRRYAECMKAGVFDGYPEDPVPLDIAKWDRGETESFEHREEPHQHREHDDDADQPF